MVQGRVAGACVADRDSLDVQGGLAYVCRGSGPQRSRVIAARLRRFSGMARTRVQRHPSKHCIRATLTRSSAVEDPIRDTFALLGGE